MVNQRNVDALTEILVRLYREQHDVLGVARGLAEAGVLVPSALTDGDKAAIKGYSVPAYKTVDELLGRIAKGEA